jgi:hypothetical protein
MAELRPYQKGIALSAFNTICSLGVVYINAEVRTGKTLMALETCKLLNAKKVLFVTKIKAFSSIQGDYDNFGYNFELVIINKESVHKINENDFDVVIYDEAHQYGSFPKPSKNQAIMRSRFKDKKIILMSGTISPESYSQMFHQFQLSSSSPFDKYQNFYKWANDYVDITKKNVGYAIVNDYTGARRDNIMKVLSEYIITFTQAESGFKSLVEEEILYVDLLPNTYKIISKLKRDLIVEGKSGAVVLADTGAKLMSKCHQLSSGTIKFEDGTSKVIDYSKANFIKERFKGKKIGIFYKYKAELTMLLDTFGDKITQDLEEFNSTDKWIAYQFVSGREGINLSKADYLVMLTIDFSAVTYFQAKDRMTVKDRLDNKIFWIFGKGTIENRIHKAVIGKKNFTLSHFKQIK